MEGMGGRRKGRVQKIGYSSAVAVPECVPEYVYAYSSFRSSWIV